MTDDAGAGHRAWPAAGLDDDARWRRDHADGRDILADTREADADERDRLADAREAELDQRELRLAAGDPDPGLADGHEARVRQRALREAARQERELGRAARAAARDKVAGDQAARAEAVRDQAIAHPGGTGPLHGNGAAAGHGRPGQAAPAAGPPAPVGHDEDEDERGWAADKRDFVADYRDWLADGRDTVANTRDMDADEREELADAREAALDEREQRLTGAFPALADEGSEDLARARQRDRERERGLRAAARQQRDQRRAERDTAARARIEAAGRRAAGGPATRLARAFADIARHLYDAENLDDVLARIARTSVSAIPGCEMASITVRQGGDAFATVAATHEAALVADEAQYAAAQGPCLTAIEEAVVYTPQFPDSRWPRLGAGPAGAGVRSVASFSLAPPGPVTGDSIAGSLNAYAGAPGAFSDEAREIGLILAAHASIAVGAIGERGALDQLGRQLNAALSSRDVIGQAKGILMERLKITPEDAFDMLRRSSQRLNVKLREIAQLLADTGELGGGGDAT